MTLSNDQYSAIAKLTKWYSKYNQQIIEVSGMFGTGIEEVLEEFFLQEDLSRREVIHLSNNQRMVHDLAAKGIHAYHLNNKIYTYTRDVDLESLPIIDPKSLRPEYKWTKQVKKKLGSRYSLMVVYDSLMLTKQTVQDLSSFGIPIILLRDPILTPSHDSYTFSRDPNVTLYEASETYRDSSFLYVIRKFLNRERVKYGVYDTVSVVPRKQLTSQVLRSSDMIISSSDEFRDLMNSMYVEKVLGKKKFINTVNDRVIINSTIYNRKMSLEKQKEIKVYLTKGTVGYISRINKHVPVTRYVGCEFRPDFYHRSFTELSLDRYRLNDTMHLVSRQIVPEEENILDVKYAYALSVPQTRLSHWDKVTLIIDDAHEQDPDLQRRLLYTAITRAKESITIVM